MFGGFNTLERVFTNALWKLTSTAKESFKWRKIEFESNVKSPVPREGSSGWEYSGKLWVFGGQGSSPDGYLNDHGDFNGNCSPLFQPFK